MFFGQWRKLFWHLYHCTTITQTVFSRKEKVFSTTYNVESRTEHSYRQEPQTVWVNYGHNNTVRSTQYRPVMHTETKHKSTPASHSESAITVYFDTTDNELRSFSEIPELEKCPSDVAFATILGQTCWFYIGGKRYWNSCGFASVGLRLFGFVTISTILYHYFAQ